MSNILEKLKGGDLRSIGRAEEVVDDVLNDPGTIGELFTGMVSDEPVVRSRAADAVEKISRVHPEYLAPFKHLLLNDLSCIEQQEVRWHVAQMFPRLKLDGEERRLVIRTLSMWLKNDASNIVRVNALQALVDFAHEDEALQRKVAKHLELALASENPSLAARARKLKESWPPGQQASESPG